MSHNSTCRLGSSLCWFSPVSLLSAGSARLGHPLRLHSYIWWLILPAGWGQVSSTCLSLILMWGGLASLHGSPKAESQKGKSRSCQTSRGLSSGTHIILVLHRSRQASQKACPGSRSREIGLQFWMRRAKKDL